MQAERRPGHLFNLDPAANSKSFEHEPAIDIRDLISLEDVMSELGYGPNGGLVYCFECATFAGSGKPTFVDVKQISVAEP
jgi:GPN-loop GTPase